MSLSVVKLENYSKKALILKLLDLEYKSVWSKKISQFEAEWNRSDTEPGWIISKKYEDDLHQIIRESRRSRRPRNDEQKYSRIKKETKSHSHGKDEKLADSTDESSSEHEKSEDESSEDEMIQLALARKLKYESSQKVIEEDNIDNSDLEDVISMCRRIRYLLGVNRQLSQRVRELEKMIVKEDVGR